MQPKSRIDFSFDNKTLVRIHVLSLPTKNICETARRASVTKFLYLRIRVIISKYERKTNFWQPQPAYLHVIHTGEMVCIIIHFCLM